MDKAYLHKITTIFFAIVGFISSVSAQSISGIIFNEDGEVIPYVNIYVTELESGTSTDENGAYFLNLDPGLYQFVFSAIGYETRKLPVEIQLNQEKDVVLKLSETALDEVVIKASKRDPAYEIIQNVIKNKDKHLKSLNSLKSDVYIKSFEVIEDINSKQKKKKSDERDDAAKLDVDPFELAEKEKQKEMAKYNFLELQLVLNYQYPQNFKEERTAFKKYGDDSGLFLPTFADCNINFYKNLVSLRSITDTPIVSPFSRTSILSYKYKLISSKTVNGILVHEIKVTPRKSGNNTVSGMVYINDEQWTINRVDLSLYKGSSKIYDQFNINQDYKQYEGDIWLPVNQVFTYETKQGRSTNFKGSTTIKYDNCQINFPFPEKYFDDEVVSITQEAYDRDSVYWNALRPIPLNTNERKLVEYKDSLQTIYDSPAYKDSIQKAFNKVEILELLWFGLGFRNHKRKEQVFLPPIPGFMNFSVVGGFRAGLYSSYFRKFKSNQFYNTDGWFSVGLKNRDLTGSIRHRFRYDPFKQGDIFFRVRKEYKLVNEYDAFINQLNVSNYYLNKVIELGHSIELFNGFRITTFVEQNWRESIEGIDRSSFLTDIIDDEGIFEFDGYNAFISYLTLSYTPKQKYMREPDRKVILGSKWPTFGIRHNKGWRQIFDSEVDFDYIEGYIEQDLILGVLGNSKYNFKAGTFLNTEDLRFLDIKQFRQSDPLLYSDPLNSFQVLDTSLVTDKPFVEAHWIHHFNGALINNIPLVKKTRISVVVGAGSLWIPIEKFAHQELFAGIERIFKIGPRRRLRLGVYGVLGNSNNEPIEAEYKFSIDIIDTWKRDWSF